MRQRFPVGSAVWCVWDGGKEYAARVMKHDEKRGEYRYKVHFTGWNSRHDEWVAESQLKINKNPVMESPTQGPVRYSPEPESSKKKNGKRRREDERPPEERMERREDKDYISRDRTDQKSSKRKIEILSDTPPEPAKRSKSARMKYSPPPKPVVPAVRARGRPPKNPQPQPWGAATASTSAASSSAVDKHYSSSSRSRYGRYEDENEASGSTTSSNRVLSPSTVRRRKKGLNGGLEIDETFRDGQRTPQHTTHHPPTDMGSPTTSGVLSLALDLYLEYGGKLRSPDEKTKRNLRAENKNEVIANMVENFKKDELELAEQRRKRTVQWCHYLQFKKRLVKDFEQYLVPTNRAPPAQAALPPPPPPQYAAANEDNENERVIKMEEVEEQHEVKMEEYGGGMEEREVKREEEEAVNGLLKEESMEGMEEEEEMGREVKKEGGSPTAATTASPTDSSPKPSVPTCSSSTAAAAAAEAQEQQQTAGAVVSPPPAAASTTTTPLTVTTSGGASGASTPLPSPALPQNLKPNPNVPQDQSYAHIPFVGAATGRDVASQMKADRAQQQMRVGTYLQQQQLQQGKGMHQKSYMMPANNGLRAVGGSSSAGSSRVMGGRPTLFVAPSIPSSGYGVNGKTPHLVQPRKGMHDSDLMQGHHSYYGGPSTSNGARGMNGAMKRDWYAQRESIEFVDDFSQGVVAEEVVVTAEEMEMDGTEPGPSSRNPPAHNFGASEVRADHCYGTTSAAKARMREQHLASREYSTSGQGGATLHSASNYAAGGNGVRQRLVVPRQYNTVSSGAPMLPSSGVRSVVSLANTSSGTSTTGFNGNPAVYIGVRPQQQAGGGGANGMARTIRFRPAPGVPPVLHTGVGGAGNVRLVDSRRLRPVYVRTAANGMTPATGQSFGVAPTRVTPAGSGMSGAAAGGGGNQRRVAYIAQPAQQLQQPNRPTRLIVPPKGSGTGGVTMAAARGADAATAAVEPACSSQPPILQPERAVQEEGSK